MQQSCKNKSINIWWINLSVIHLIYQNRDTMTQDFNNYATTQTANAFINMVKIEMMLSGKSFKESKEVVKAFLKQKGLM